MGGKIVTIERHISEIQRRFPQATGEFSALLNDLALAAKIIGKEVNKAGLVDILGFTGDTNVHGEQVQKLDEYADSIIFRALDHTGRLCVMASEEREEIIPIPEKFPTGNYVLLYDPLDGSSNIDANVSIGTIFSIYRKCSDSERGTVEDCIRQGAEQIAAGYVIYGSSTMLVFTTGNGVHGFTYDPSVGEFFLSHNDIKIPNRGKIYSVNEGNTQRWEEGTKNYVNYLKQVDKETNRPYSSRYIGSLVADFHRNLLYGGIFLYPTDKKNPNGKLRLMYEANPLAFVVEQAGGYASDGQQRILDKIPESIHQKTALIIGSHDDVREAEDFIQGKRSC
ncbi:MAG: class 1 fructose-bisphosphatase [bacterium]